MGLMKLIGKQILSLPLKFFEASHEILPRDATPDEIEEYKRRKLSKIVDLARVTPYYQSRTEWRNLLENKERAIDALLDGSAPVITKKELLEANPYNFVPLPYRDNLVSFSSSGTLGEPVKLYYREDLLRKTKVFSLRALVDMGVSGLDNLLTIPSFNHLSGLLVKLGASLPFSYMIDRTVFGYIMKKSEHVKKYREYLETLLQWPNFIGTYSMLLLQILAKYGDIISSGNLEYAVTMSAPNWPLLRKYWKELGRKDSNLRETYGATEWGNSLFADYYICKLINEDFVHVLIETGNGIKRVGTGRIVITHLWPIGILLLNYNGVGDIIKVSGEGFRKIEILGRDSPGSKNFPSSRIYQAIIMSRAYKEGLIEPYYTIKRVITPSIEVYEIMIKSKYGILPSDYIKEIKDLIINLETYLHLKGTSIVKNRYDAGMLDVRIKLSKNIQEFNIKPKEVI